MTRLSAAPTTILVLAAFYFIAAKLGLTLAFVNPSATAVWPPSGIALAALLVLGRRAWPGIFLGAFLANITTAGSIATSAGIAAGNTLEGLTGSYLVERFANGRRAFDHPQDVFTFALLAGMLSTIVSATCGVASLSLGGFADWSNAGAIWLTWWLGDAAGDLVVAPVLLLWSAPPRIRWDRNKIVEAVSVSLLMLLAGLLVFGGLLPARVRNYPLNFIYLPILIWTAFQFAQRETAAVGLLLSTLAIWGTLHGFGPFVKETRNVSLLLLQAFLGVTSITSLAVASVAAERKEAEQALRQSRDSLELQVQTRTASLARTVKELEREVSQRKQAEEKLSRSNRKLDQFATVVCHELQEPVRKIRIFGDMIRLKARSSTEEWQYAQKMEEAVERMQRLIESILALSRVTTNAQPITLVDLNAVLREVASDFTARVAQVGGEIRVDFLPTVRAEGLQMRQLFENLVSNAYKFRSKDAPPRIRVSCGAPREGFVQIAVEDNGIGFEEQYRSRIFKPFQRLHRRADYEGSGMGLAICRRIVVRHGGEITAKSEVGKGSIFVVSLPTPG